MTPALDGRRIDRLPGLPPAECADDPLDAVEITAARIPRQADELDHGAAPVFRILDESLVRNIQNRPCRQVAPPVLHDAPILTVIMREIAQVVCVGVNRPEILEVDGKAGVDGIAL